MKIEFTDDKEFAISCLTSPKAWRMGVDDALAGVDPELLVDLEKRDQVWVKTEYGLFIGMPVNYVTYDCHIALLESVRGRAVDVCKQVLDFVFDNTRIQRLTASIPIYNPLACKLAEKCGFEFIGINRKSFLRGGVLHDQRFYGISKQ